MKKKVKIAFLALLTISIIYAVTLMQSLEAYNAWKEAEMQNPLTGDPYPFFESSFGKLCVLFSIALALCYLAIPPLVVDKSDLTKLAAFFLGAIIALSILVVPRAFATPEVIHIDILCCCDEEFDTGTILVPSKAGIGPIIWVPKPSKRVAEDDMAVITEYFQEELRIELHWHYWLTFDDRDDINYNWDILNEAIEEIGWKWNITYHEENNDENMELLAVFTQQQTVYKGISIFWLRAFQVSAKDMFKTMVHELGHQFHLQHCDNYCIMRETDAPTYHYCTNCKNELTTYRTYPLTPVPIFFTKPYYLKQLLFNVQFQLEPVGW